jgi:hypothetical protein
MVVRLTQLQIREYSQSVACEASQYYKACTFGETEDSNLCTIHDIFKNETGQNSHSCIACNLSDISEYLFKSLNNLITINNQFDAFISFCLPAYLLVERFEEIFRIIKLPEYYEQSHFQILKLIRRWANFLKHPKAFLFVHHPEFYFEKEVSIDNSKNEYTIINTEFINEHYTGNTKNAELYKILTNNDKVIVLFPNLLELTERLITAQNNFIDIIINNKVFREVLIKKSVLINYFENLDKEQERRNDL